MAGLQDLPKIAVLSPLVSRILGCNPGGFTLQGTNTYIIGKGSRRMLIDTGDGTREYASILGSFLRDHSIELSDVLLTHWHPDHVGGINDIVNIVCANQRRPPVIRKYPNYRDDALPSKIVPVASGEKFVTEDGTATLVAYHTPGHADDHLVFVLEEEGAIFSGDNVLGEGSTVFQDLSQYIKSLQTMKDLGEKAQEIYSHHKGLPFKLYPGHGPVISDGSARIIGYIEHRQQRERQLVEVMQSSGGPMSISAMADILYQNVPASVRNAAERGLNLHLRKLEDEKRVTHDQDSGEWQLVRSQEKLGIISNKGAHA
uniref:ARAD1D42900p n=1 Tax=Blastobotrys adeninivorans TaxID=409370 RepID=A0A060TDD6_BLAAD